MLELAGYRVVEQIGSDDEISFYRLLRLDDSLHLIAKTTSAAYAGSDMAAVFQLEYEQMLRLRGKGVLEPLSLATAAGSRPVMLLRDPGGTTLQQWLQTHRASLKLEHLLKAAIAMAEGLHRIHQEQIALHEIMPLNLMLNDDLTEIAFMDLRSCKALRGKNAVPSLGGRPDRVLPYLSPEQTGRTGRVPDFRSDFYSLGVILYEWFSRCLPFPAQEAMDLVYQHLAATPEPVHVRNPSIPRIVSEIVRKCLEKMPEARYASAYGIRSDLEECLIQLRNTGKIQPFPLAKHDVSERWMAANGFMGRNAEREQLLQAMQRIAGGSSEVIWVSGSEGVGKTALVLETLGHVNTADVLYASAAASESAAEPRPYACWERVMEQWVARLLTVNAKQAEEWKARIWDAAQGNGKLLTERVPRLALLIGEQPDPEELPPAAARMRAHRVFNRFFQLFPGREKPSVIFMDDLQRADEASIQYLHALLKDGETKHLLIVGAYREQELDRDHPLKQVMQQLGDEGIPMRHIHLSAYDHAALKRMLGHLLHSEADGGDRVIQILLRKTEGNPLAVKQFLQDLRDRRLVTFDERRRTWQWDVQRIEERNVSEQVADTITASLSRLPEQVVYLLGRAAFLGKQFDLQTLSAIMGLSLEEAEERVQSAALDRLLQPMNGEGVHYAFQHERIWQAAIELVPEGERTALHMIIGWHLAERWRAGEDVSLDSVLSHLNPAVEQAVHQGKKQELAELNLQAGLQAKKSAAVETSLAYFRMAATLLEDEGWENDYPLTYQAHKERAEAEFLNANFTEAQHLFDLLMAKAATDLEKAQVCLLMIRMESNRDRFQEVIALGEQALGLLGIRYRFVSSPLKLARQWASVRWKLRKFPVESLGSLAPMTDVRVQTALSVLDNISQASFVLNKSGWFSSILTILELTMEHGLTPEASVGFVGYALTLNFQLHQYDAAYQWGRLACEISKSNPRLHALSVATFSLCYDSWRRHDPGFLPAAADQAAQAVLQSGDLWNANQTMLVNCGLLFQFARPLKDVYVRLLSHADPLERNRNLFHLKQAALLARMITDLTGHRIASDPFAGIDVQAETFVAEVSGDKGYFLQESVYTYQYITGYLFGDYEKAYTALEGCERLAKLRPERSSDSLSHEYYRVLVLNEFMAAGNKRERADRMRRMRASIRKLKTLARRSPENALHKYALAKAVAASLRHKDRHAELLYEQAMEAAQAHGHLHDAGIIAESYARYGLSRGKMALAKFYLQEAYESYKQWGALAKAVDLETKFSQWLQTSRRTEPDMDRIDYLSVVKSAQALSGEMEMDKLLRVLMRLMLQNAGAEYGALIMAGDDRWIVEAYGSAEELHIESIPLENAEHLVPTGVIDYTARTKEQVVLHDAEASGMLERSEYIKRKARRSVICLPILHQNQLIGLLYMENNLSTGVFTKERLDVLMLLSAQCAISIANAKLYAGMQDLKNSLEDQVAERTRTLEKSMQAISEALAETTVYAERTRIAQEIHDIVGHTLTSTVLQIEAGKRLLRKDIDSAVLRLKEAQDLVRHSLNEIRNSVHMLKEDKLYDIESAMRQLIQDTERNTGVVVHVSMDPVPHLSFMHKKVIYHALQEGLTNGIRHGGSSEFHYRLQDDGSQVSFTLADNGKGAERIEMGFGLSMMKDRVQQLRGDLFIDSEPGNGSLLRIQLPYTS